MLLVLSLVGLVAIGSNRLAERLRIPAPALFLITAAVASDLVPELGRLPIVDDQRIVTVALPVILFDGGMHIGWERMRPSLGGVLWLGVVGTLVMTAALAVAAHSLLGFDWTTALIIGAALAPTEPAVMFSVLGRREISGRSGTLLEGEPSANEPVGIALMVSLLVSVLVQGGLVPTAARVFGVPMRVTEPEPWPLGMRFRERPAGLHRYVVAPGSRADGCTLADLDVGESFWVSMVSRDGRLVQVRGDTVLEAGDEVLALAEEAHSPDDVFAEPQPPGPGEGVG